MDTAQTPLEKILASDAAVRRKDKACLREG